MARSILFLFFALLFISNTTFSQSYSFITNKGQWEQDFKYKTYIPDGAMFFCKNKIVFNFQDGKQLTELHDARHELAEDDFEKRIALNETMIRFHAFSVTFENSNEDVQIHTTNAKKEFHNYFIGNDKSKWKSNVPLYANLQYKNLYDGIDYQIYTSDKQLKYDFVIAPNADVSQIKLNYEGAITNVLPNGNLRITTSINEFEEMAPYAYQIIDGKKIEVPCKFVVIKNKITYHFPDKYNKNIELTIDPIMVFQTYSGGSPSTYGWSATYDYNGYLLAGGECFGSGWPVTLGAYQSSFAGNIDVSINRYSADGSSLINATYYGGSSGDFPSAMICNKNNELVIAGYTQSSNLPTTIGCYDNSANGFQDIFVVHFDSNLTVLKGSTYIGGSASDGHAYQGVILDALGNIGVSTTTSSANFPTTAGAYSSVIGTSSNAILFILDSNCTTLLGSTAIGGAASTATLGYGIDHLTNGDFLISGRTNNTNFPTSSTAYLATFPGTQQKGFVSRFNPTCTSLIASTLIGTAGSTDLVKQVRVDLNDDVYIFGSNSLGNYPVSSNVYSTPLGKMIIQKLDPLLSFSFLSTRCGSGTPMELMVDSCNYVYISSLNASSTNPVTPNAFQTTFGSFWLCVLSPGMQTLHYSTFMGVSGDHVDGGGSRFNPKGIVYHSVCTISGTAYTWPTSYSPTKLSSSWDIASFKFDFEIVNPNGNFVIGPKDSVCSPANVSLSLFTNNTSIYSWNYGDGSPLDTSISPSHIYTTAGIYTITLIVSDTNTFACVISDTIQKILAVFEPTNAQYIKTVINYCSRDSLYAQALGVNPTNTIYQWNINNVPSGNDSFLNYNFTIGGTYTIQLITKNAVCSDTSEQTIIVEQKNNLQVAVLPDSICIGSPIVCTNNSSGNAITSFWNFGDGQISNSAASSFTHIYAAPGLYNVTYILTNALNCIDTSSFTIFVDGPIYNTFSVGQPQLCQSDTVFATDSFSSAVTDWVYSFGDNSLDRVNIRNPYHVYKNPGNYTFQLIANYAICPTQTVQKSIVVSEFPDIDLGPDQNICPGLDTLNISGPQGIGWQYLWSTGETTPNIKVSNIGIVKLTIVNGTCTSTDSFRVFGNIKCTSVPNAFSPNSDGKNDYFNPIMVDRESAITYKFTVYNRWGEVLYFSYNNKDNGWDGNFKSKACDMGTYFYTFYAKDRWGNEKNFQGDVTLIR
jgi:gliding motility-associated-like protein